ncbi:MAG: N-acetyl-alpha-D-glucosaminyl L-malate synthase BshA [Candidatus Eisenbacteria bacterium]|uniref:N-acetyl-alpha-D-glucosaminyl L-malate synthase BshA n=1 Tax=Eiseniibacteriota bacterium TaxID=2212470 RepID=A0A956NCG8_UNCEI|nr:N-acetyl-alpha-D-glucosaminyl L-malate synthase BshA [Candidatus Eisenbacteria bacterium]
MSEKNRVGIVCYPSSGGSGIVATELGLALAHRGWEVHFITYAQPLRLQGFESNVFFHEVQTDNYPVFHHPPYTLSLAVKIHEVAEAHGLDVLHVHYAIPHATAAYLAKQMFLPKRLPVVTTLHGTDITLVGVQPAFHRITRFSIEESDRVTAVSQFLRQKTVESFGVEREIEVIPNFVDPDKFRPLDERRLPFCANRDEKIVVHASNFRPVKNIPSVIHTFAKIREAMPARLLLVGDGPERYGAQELVGQLGLQKNVHFLGIREGMSDLLGCADLYLLPSEHESFGLSALEAMSCGAPVIATSRGGTGEVVVPGVTGYLCDPHDIDEMGRIAVELLSDQERHRLVGQAARKRVLELFTEGKVIAQYEQVYRELTGEAVRS